MSAGPVARPPTEFDTDVLIVGSGFGGSVAALRLVEKGYRVLVLEKGKRWRSADFPTTNWNIPRAFWLPWASCYGTWGLLLLPDVLVLHGVGVGGGSLLYANTHLEPATSVWDDPSWKGLADWRSVMPQHYATARRMLGSVTSPRLDRGDEALRAAAARRGFGDSFHPTSVGIFFGKAGEEVDDPYFGGEGPRRTGCTYCGACMVGCRQGAKNTLDKNYLYLAERRGARILPETQAVLIEGLPGGGYRVHWRRSTDRLFPERGVYTARRVVVSAGVLGTCRLLMESRRRGGLPRLSERLGTLVRTNSEALLGVTSRRYDDLWEGHAIQAEVHVDDHTRMEMVRFPKGSDVMMLLGTLLTDGGGDTPRPLRWLGNLAAHPLAACRASFPFGKAKRSQVLLVMQTIDNYTRLSLQHRAAWPFRRSLSSRTPAGQSRIPSYIPIANAVARDVAAELDGVAQSTLTEVLMGTSVTAHILGGCGIGPTPAEGVIDGRFEAFGHPGLFVMDGSVIAANLGANPSLTITALAEYACAAFPPPPGQAR